MTPDAQRKERMADAVLVVVAALGGYATKPELERIIAESGVMRLSPEGFAAWCSILGPFVRVQNARVLAHTGCDWRRGSVR